MLESYRGGVACLSATQDWQCEVSAAIRYKYWETVCSTEAIAQVAMTTTNHRVQYGGGGGVNTLAAAFASGVETPFRSSSEPEVSTSLPVPLCTASSITALHAKSMVQPFNLISLEQVLPFDPICLQALLLCGTQFAGLRGSTSAGEHLWQMYSAGRPRRDKAGM